jgi:hypothetical protein
MNDLLWLVNHSLRGNLMGISTSQNPDTPEGLESRFSVRICRILAELPHLTEPEFGKLCRTRTDSGGAFMLKLLWGFQTSWEVLRPSEPHLSLSILQILNLEALWGAGGGAKPNFLYTFCWGSTVVFTGGVRRCSGQRLGAGGPLVRPADHATWPGGHVSSLHYLSALDTLSTAYTRHMASRPHLGLVEPVLCATLFPPDTPWLGWARALCHVISTCHIFCDYALFWT